ncbi:MAG: radical SAM family heme chaperone HemW [Phycisphaerales bacterium]|nr:radical SAM family heme chaperone HemW [Phycisphaerales bacterium]
MSTVHASSYTHPSSTAQFTIIRDEAQGINTRNAEDWLAQASEVSGAYIHVPFCFHKCHYCDFYSIIGVKDSQADFVDALEQEFKAVGPYINAPLSSIFIGGGTPTLLEGKLLTKMLRSIALNFPTTQEIEWTIEANPETITPDIARRLVDGGVNRVSIGAQSFDEDCLKALERWHTPESVGQSVEVLREAGIKNINLDLIFAIPNQTIEIVHEDLRKATELEVEHISSYALSFEPNTPLTVRQQRGDVKKIDEDLEAKMFEATMEMLTSQGFEHYEISNYAKPDKECKHNLLYWNNGNWWPFGPAAAGYVNGLRWRNVPRFSQYAKHDGLPLIEEVEFLSPSGQAGESLMLGLRLKRGIHRKRISKILSVDGGLWRVEVLEKHIESRLIHWKDDHLCLTKRGLMLADPVIGDLLMEESSMVDTSEQETNG